ncbi:unnamed protein product [Ixodes pacificus]
MCLYTEKIAWQATGSKKLKFSPGPLNVRFNSSWRVRRFVGENVFYWVGFVQGKKSAVLPGAPKHDTNNSADRRLPPACMSPAPETRCLVRRLRRGHSCALTLQKD